MIFIQDPFIQENDILLDSKKIEIGHEDDKEDEKESHT